MDKSDKGVQLWLAAVLLTRAPLPRLPARAQDMGAAAVWAYPVVGMAVGAAGAIAGLLALWLGLPVLAAAGITLGAMMLATGAMHEDGLADVFDGFWGGFTPARRLEIMRDSQLGTYGVLGLLVVSLIRLAFWHRFWVPAAGTGGRRKPVTWSDAAVMHLLPHARDTGLSQSVGQPAGGTAGMAFGIGAAICLLCIGSAGIVAIVAGLAVTAGMMLLAKRKICGQTGDVLGAVQQLSETAILLSCAALL